MNTEKLEMLEELEIQCVNHGMVLHNYVHFCWCQINMCMDPLVSIEMIDDLYIVFVSGVLYNLGSGKIPEYMEGIGPSPEERYSKEGYKKLFNQLTSLTQTYNPIEEWLVANPRSTNWIDIVEESFAQDKIDPEQRLIDLRKKIIEKKYGK